MQDFDELHFAFSEEFVALSDVPQGPLHPPGSLLVHTVYKRFRSARTAKRLLFADDIKLFGTVKCLNDGFNHGSIILGEDILDSISVWCYDHGMSLNIE